MYILLLWGEMLQKYQLKSSDLIFHFRLLFPYRFSVWMIYLSISVSEVLKSPRITVLMSISPFMSLSICFINLGAPTVLPPLLLEMENLDS